MSGFQRKEEIFNAVFSEIYFPYTSIDIIKLSEAIALHQTPKSWYQIFVPSDTERIDAYVGAMMGLVLSISPSLNFINFIESSKLLNQVMNKHITLLEQITSSLNKSFVTWANTEKDSLIWQEESYWPFAYNKIVQQLNGIIFAHKLIAEAEISPVNEVFRTNGYENTSDFVTDRPPHLPTEIQYAAASLGAYLGGASNMHYFLHYACKYQLMNSGTNIEFANEMNYNNHEAEMMDKSGIICVPHSLSQPLLQAQEYYDVLGGIPIDEFSFMNPPNNITRGANVRVLMDDQNNTVPTKYQINVDKKCNVHDGFIVDKYYRSVYTACDIHRPLGLFGARNVFRDHYKDFYSKICISDLLRCKQFCVPVVNVCSKKEMEDIVAQIPTLGDGRIFFRGQTKLHNIQRSSEIKSLLFADSCNIEPSLITSASRSNFNYDWLHFLVRYFFTDEYIINKLDITNQEESVKDLWQELSTDPACMYDYAIMALSQHYGLPTNGLDVTSDLDVAIWFATNKFETKGSISKYVALDECTWATDKNNLPIVFVCQSVLNTTSLSLVDCQMLDKLGIHALRPERQSAKFFLGAHSEHQNRLAETIVCAFRLNYGSYATSVDFDYLFPSPYVDKAYHDMLKFNDTVLKQQYDGVCVHNFYHD